ncbi:MAG: cytochrome c biogenesis protein ResB [Clostridia bacterium]|nr:cytochrome c biogenesis protein ResB [Clostridia bacterium]
MPTIKKVWKFIGSMRFAIALLALLAAACSLGSLVTQGQSYAWYAERYSERTAALILALRLDDAFHSWWFMLINAFLCVNLLLCNVTKLPQLARRTRAAASAEEALRAPGDACAETVAEPGAAFRQLRMPAPRAGETPEGRKYLFSSKNRAGLWGAWVCHLGILLLIAGFALGQMTQKQYTVYGVPGQAQMIGDTGYALVIDDFRVDTREDGSVEQYTTGFTLQSTRSVGPSGKSAVVSVNNPAALYGMKFYQNSTGWAASVSVYENGEPLQEEILCAGEYLRVADKQDLAICLNALYPDYVQEAGSMPATASDQPVNPAYLYSVYYQERIIGMNVLTGDDVVTIDEYTVAFSDPQRYTLIQIKRDRFTGLALAGGLLTMLGLLLALYLQPVRVWAVQDGEGAWTLFGASRKGGVLFREEFARAADAAGKPAEGENSGASD